MIAVTKDLPPLAHWLIALFCLFPCSLAAMDYDPVDFVDPAIGANKATGGVNRSTNNTVGATAPYGMIQLGPDEELKQDQRWAGLHLNIPAGNGASQGMGFVGKILPVAGSLGEYWPNRDPDRPDRYLSDVVVWEHLLGEPGYLRGQVIHDGVTMTVETTVGLRFGLIRLSRPDAGPISIYMPQATAITSEWMDGQERYSGKGMFHWSARLQTPADAVNSHGAGYNNRSEIIIMVGISSISSQAARGNMPDNFPDFDAVAAATKAEWNQQLSQVRLAADTPDAMKTKFYTGLYRMLTYPQIYSDADGRYRRYHESNTMGEIIVDTLPDDWEIYYTHFSGWDTYRIHTPFMALLDPHIASEQARTQLQDGRDSEGGKVPKWRRWDHDSGNMTGNSGAVITAWSYLLGANGFAFDQAGDLDILNNRGLDGNPRKPSPELDHGMAKFVLGLLGEKLGEDSYASARLSDSQRWWELWNPAAEEVPDGGGAIRAKDSDGNWKLDGTYGYGDGSDYVEAGQDDTQWLPHWDLAELVERMGGTGVARARLARYMWDDEINRSRCFRTYNDHFTLYNQPVYSIPWTWGQIGDMHAQVREVHRIINDDFLNIHGSQALPGNDDLGATSAWMVWSVLGMYPYWPGLPVVALNLPMIEHATLDLGGKTLTVSRSGEGDAIAQVLVNGVAIDTTWVALGQLLENEHNSLHFTTSTSGVWGLGATPPNWRQHTRTFPLAKPGIRAPEHINLPAGTTSEITVMIHDLVTPAADLSMTVHSDDQTLIADGDLTLSGPWHKRQLTVTTAAANGATALHIQVTNQDGLSHSQRIAVVVGDGPSENSAPIADAGNPLSLTTVSGASSAGVVLDGSASYDPDGSIVSYAWSWSGGSASGLRPLMQLPIGSTEITLTVTDNNGASHSDTVTITVNENDNLPPLARPGADRWLTLASGEDTIAVTLDASSSSDPDGEIVLYTWDWEGGGASGVTPTVDLSPGVYDMTLTVIDNQGLSASASLTITVYQSLAWESRPNTHVEAEQTYTYTLQSSGGNPDTIEFSSSGLPDWLSLSPGSNPGSAILSGSPSSADVGAVAVSITASDGQRSIAQPFTITVWDIGAGLGTRFRISIPDYQGPAAVDDYPLLVRLGTHIDSFHYDLLAYPASGSDLRFSLPDGTPLPFSIGHWDPTGTSSIWLRVPRVDAELEVLMTLGDADHSSLPGSASDGSVWAGRYDSVWHLDEATGERQDQSANELHAQALGPVASVDGMIGKAARFDGSNGDTALQVGTGLSPTHQYSNRFTFESWLWIERLAPRGYTMILSQNNTYHQGSGYHSDLLDNAIRTSVGTQAGTGSGDARQRSSADLNEMLPEEEWVHVATSWDGDTIRTFFNGEQIGEQSFAHTIDYPSGDLNPLLLGASWSSSLAIDRSLSGALDDVRIAGQAHSPAWIWLTYHSANNADFLLIEPDVGNELPQITSHPQSQAIVLGEQLTLSVSASGSELSYQWQHQGSPIAGATAASYSVAESDLNDGGSYRVLVTNPHGSVLSQEAVITILSRIIRMDRIDGTLWSIDPLEHAGADDDGSQNPVPFGPLPADRDHVLQTEPSGSG